MDDRGALHTLDELTELVEAALSVDYRGAPTGRVRDVPDRRAIRWYVTRGLVDRPAATRGRLALYNHRHLLQLVAIKRRQEQGRSLAEIQAELAGATDGTLATVARLSPIPDISLVPNGSVIVSGSLTPDSLPVPPSENSDTYDRPTPASSRPRFWTARPASPSLHERDSNLASAEGSPRERDISPASTHAGPGHRRLHAPRSGSPSDGSASGEFAGDASAEAVTLRGFRLAPGVTLLVDDLGATAVDPKDLLAAARPLLDLLAAGGHAPHAPEEE